MAIFQEYYRQYIDYLTVLALMTISLGLGTTIYYSAEEDLVGMGWIRNISPHLDQFFQTAATTLPGFLTTTASQNHLPDFCWSFSISILFIRIWISQMKKNLAYSLSVVVACSYEMAQLFDLMPGVFDLLDVMVSAFAGILSCYLVIQIRSAIVKNNK